MLKKALIILGMVASITCLSSCGNKSTTQATNEATNEKTAVVNRVGSDRDEHGCIASAGYQWSELLKDCIRPFEIGIKMASAVDKESTSAAYLVFNADSSKVEVFLPQEKNHPILQVSASGNDKIWANDSKKDLTIKQVDGRFSLYINETLHDQQVIK